MAMPLTDDMDDEKPALSSTTLAALAEFLAEREDAEKKCAELHAKAQQDFDDRSNAADESMYSMQHFAEDWQLSQFWASTKLD